MAKQKITPEEITEIKETKKAEVSKEAKQLKDFQKKFTTLKAGDMVKSTTGRTFLVVAVNPVGFGTSTGPLREIHNDLQVLSIHNDIEQLSFTSSSHVHLIK
jgi:cell division protein FtsX